MHEDTFHLGVKALIRNAAGDILLLKLDPKKFGERWDLPGGRLQKNETLLETLKREIYEETGLQNLDAFTPFAMALSPIRISLPTTNVGLVLATYFCQAPDQVSVCLSDEHVHYAWFAPRKAAELLTPNFPQELVTKLSSLY